MSEKTTPALLPNGLKDLLPPDAQREADIIHHLMASFSQFGFQRVKPPLVEFEETLLADGPGQDLARNTFRLMDPLSQNMMGVRADTTAQIVRIANSRLKGRLRPLRLSYAADVLRVNGYQLRPERQFCQVGCELIGASNMQDDVEISLLALKSLHAVGIKNLSIDLALPTLMMAIFEEYKLPQDRRDLLENYMNKRDRDGLQSLQDKETAQAAGLIVEVLDCSGLAQEAIVKLKKIKFPKALQASIENLSSVYDALSAALKIYELEDIKITMDLVERRGFEYQSGVSFTFFAPHVRGELGRGGRYEVGDEEATGFTLYMDSVIQAANIKGEDMRRVVAPSTDWSEIKALQDQGFEVCRGGE